MSAAPAAVSAAREAATLVVSKAPGPARLAVVFVSASYADAGAVAPVLREVLGEDVPLVGGTSAACVLADDRLEPEGVSILLLGGDDVEVACASTRIATRDLVEVVPTARAILAASEQAKGRGLDHGVCLVFAPSVEVDGDALVAAVRKGAGEGLPLAGCATGDDLKRDPPKVFIGDAMSTAHVCLAGVFSRAPIGVAARHGWRAAGPVHSVTRSDGAELVLLDGRPAREVWVEDARKLGGDPPADEAALTVYLNNHFLLGVVDVLPRAGAGEDPLVIRAPLSMRPNGAVLLSGAISEGTRVGLVVASTEPLLAAAESAADRAVERAGGRAAGGLVFACTSRRAALGDLFAEEPRVISAGVRAPLAGGCVYGEIARNVRATDAFFNSTVVIVAFGGAAL